MTIAFSITKPASIGTAINASDVNTPVSEVEQLFEDIVNGVQDVEIIRFTEISAPAAPTSGDYKVYFKSGTSGKAYVKNSAGTEYVLFDPTATSINILQVQVFS